MTTMNAAELRERAAQLGWYHSIDLGQGVITPGLAHRDFALEEALPEFQGRSVLDIGAWDGGFSFLAEKRGATRVVALDHYMWCLDFAARQAYWDRCAAEGTLPDPDRDQTDFWAPELMTGRRSFDFAREVLQSRVEPVVADFMTTDLDALGTFDVVLHLGVLYHMREPLTALRRLRQVTGEVAVIETVAVDVPGYRRQPLVMFYPGDELHGDHTNWFAHSEAALHASCRAAGFSRVETQVGRPRTRLRDPLLAARRRLRGGRRWAADYRIVVHAFP